MMARSGSAEATRCSAVRNVRSLGVPETGSVSVQDSRSATHVAHPALPGMIRGPTTISSPWVKRFRLADLASGGFQALHILLQTGD